MRSGPLGWILELGFENADAGEIAVAFGEIEAVANDEAIGDLEAHEVGLELDFTPADFVEEYAGADAGGVLLFDEIDDDGEGFAGIQNVIDQQHVAVGDIEREIIEEPRFPVRFGVVAVTGDADAIESDGVGDLPQEIGREENGAVDDGDDRDLFLAVDGGDISPEFLQATLDRRLAYEDGFEIFGLDGCRLRFGHREGVKLSGPRRQQLPCITSG